MVSVKAKHHKCSFCRQLVIGCAFADDACGLDDTLVARPSMEHSVIQSNGVRCLSGASCNQLDANALKWQGILLFTNQLLQGPVFWLARTPQHEAGKYSSAA